MRGHIGMAVRHTVGRYAGRKVTRRLSRSIPWIGAAVALLTLGTAIRNKGWLRGTLHTVLDAVPYVGGVKNTAEIIRGRDFFPDRVRTIS